MVTIRPYEPADAAGLIALINEGYSEPMTAEQFAAQEARRSAELPFIRMVAVSPGGGILGQAIAVGGHELRQGHARAFVRVAAAQRRQGVGSQLFAGLVAAARTSGLTTLEGNATANESGAPNAAFMAATGWQEIGQVYFSRLKLTDLDLAPHQGALDVALAKGFRFEPLTEQGGDEELLQRYHAFISRMEQDVPGRGPLTPSYPIWRAGLDAESWRPEHILLALDSANWAAVSAMEVQEDGVGYTALTAVDPAYRGHRLGLAMKVVALKLAQELGLDSVTTYNHVNNAPMLAVNQKFGYSTEHTVRQFAYQL